MKKYLLLLVPFATGFAVASESIPPKEILEDMMITSKVAGICSTYEKMFSYQQITGRSDDLEFARRFFTYGAKEINKTPDQLMDLCKEAYSSTAKYREMLSEMN